MTQIAIFPTMEEAYIAKGMLESHGIPTRIIENSLNTIYPAPNAYNGGITLFCPDDKAGEASRLLREHGDIV